MHRRRCLEFCATCLSVHMTVCLGGPEVRSPTLGQAGAALGTGFPAATPVAVILAATSLLTASLKTHDDDGGGH